ncbi:hypothetical protein C4D60_Mb01t22350 [Musa balbisiana]|uniref:Uncharacterized protein n=1 Tax=Musa balbisiana TaxID=52838 RepID=A0A4S8JQ76_MUSBA|nr:hypothetical protein C4D60_Mb01t22350 [Musa balbisiana]
MLAWREGLGLTRTLMRLGRRSDPFDQVLLGRSRREASSEAADVNPSLAAIIILISKQSLPFHVVSGTSRGEKDTKTLTLLSTRTLLGLSWSCLGVLSLDKCLIDVRVEGRFLVSLDHSLAFIGGLVFFQHQQHRRSGKHRTQ